VWAEAEYLLWWMRGAPLPPLVTTSPAGTPINQAGVLGAPVLFGGSRANDEARSGFRVGVGGWFDEPRTWGAEASFFLLETKATGFVARSDGSTILSRPFVDAGTGRPGAERIAFPGDVSGAVSASEAGSGLLGAGALLRMNLCCGCGTRLDLLGGYRYLRFTDSLGVTESLTSTSPNSPVFIPPGTLLDVTDRFHSRNQFHGGDLGLAGEFQRGTLSLCLLTKLAIGGNHQDADIAGGTTVTAPGAAPVRSPGGLLAQTTNSGHHSRDEVSLVPELGLKLGYQATPHLRFSVGYTYLYWSDVVRAGNQVDLTVNPNLVPGAPNPGVGPSRPAFGFQGTNFWTQGLDVAIQFSF
jgi:hypothetical protein